MNYKGFTLVELLVAISMFSIFTVASVAAFTSFINYQRTSHAEREVLENLNRVIDSISRELRLGQEYEVTNDDKCITFQNQLGSTTKFRFVENSDKGSIERGLGENTTGDDENNNCANQDANGGWISLTSSDVDVDSAEFVLVDDSTQPRVKLSLSGDYQIVLGEGEDNTIKNTFSFQTQVTQRVFNAIDTSRFTIGNARGGSSHLLSYIYNDDGNCIDEIGFEYEPEDDGYTPCKDPTSLVSIVPSIGKEGAGVRSLYALGANGRVFFLKDAITKLTSTSPVGIKAVRVKGIKGSGVCRGSNESCRNDPTNVISLIEGSNGTVYALSSSGFVYRLHDSPQNDVVNKFRAKRIIGSDTVKVNKFGIVGDLAVVSFKEGSKSKFRILPESDLGEFSNFTNTCGTEEERCNRIDGTQQEDFYSESDSADTLQDLTANTKFLGGVSILEGDNTSNSIFIGTRSKLYGYFVGNNPLFFPSDIHRAGEKGKVIKVKNSEEEDIRLLGVIENPNEANAPIFKISDSNKTIYKRVASEGIGLQFLQLHLQDVFNDSVVIKDIFLKSGSGENALLTEDGKLYSFGDISRDNIPISASIISLADGFCDRKNDTLKFVQGVQYQGGEPHIFVGESENSSSNIVREIYIVHPNSVGFTETSCILGELSPSIDVKIEARAFVRYSGFKLLDDAP